MTVTANTTRNQYTAGNQQNTYAYTFQIHDASDLKVYIGDELKSLNTHYTVTGVGSGTGGNVVFDLGVDGNGDQIYIPQNTVVSIFLAMDLDRDTNYQPSGAFLASTVNNDFDRLWLASNQQQTDINRTVRLQDLDSQSNMTLPLLADRADKLFAFGPQGSGAPAVVVTNNSSQWDIAYNNMITGMQFQSGGILRLSQQDGSDYTVDLDGRYHLIGTDIPDADISESSVTQHRTAMLDVPTNVRAKFGDGDELEIYYDGTTSFIKESGANNLAILGDNLFLGNPDATKNYLVAQDGGSVVLYYNGVQKLSTDSTGINVIGTVEFDGLSGTGSVIVTDILDEDDMSSNSATALATQQSIKAYVDANGGGTATGVDLADNVKATFGDGDDLEIYHDGSNSYIHDTGTGGLYIRGSDEIALRSSSNENIFLGLTDGSAYVYHDGSVKLQTTSTGIDVTGTVDTDGLVVDTDTLYVDATNDRVGIGTTSPDQKLDVSRADVGNLAIFQTEDGTNNPRLTLSTTSTGVKARSAFSTGIAGSFEIEAAGGSSYISLNPNSSEAMRIKADGKVGIGTTNPQEELHISAAIPKVRLQDSDGTNQYGEFFHSNGTTAILARNNTTDGTIVFQKYDGSTTDETVRIDSSGNVGIGTNSPSTTLDVNGTVTATAFAGDGSALTGLPAGGISNVVEDTTPQLGGDLDAQDNEINNVDKLGINTSSPSVACDVQFVKTGDLVAGLRVHTSASTSYDGKVITWGEQTGESGVLGWADGYALDSCYIASGITGLRFQRTFGSSPKIVPCSSTGAINDNAIDLGDSNARFDDIYATNTSIISTSDSTLKQDVETLTDAEERVAVACKGLLRKFRWRDAVEEKGDDARIHFGIMAQDLRDAFTAEGLDAGRYGMFISNTWWEHEGEHYPTSESAPEGATEVTRLGVRYSELLAFIISAI